MSSGTHESPTFLDLYLNGEVLGDEIDDFIDTWHANPGGKEIYEFLGMSKEEYSLWLRDPDTLPHIARARRAGLPLAVVLRTTLEEFPIAARSASATKIDRLRSWLRHIGKISL